MDGTRDVIADALVVALLALIGVLGTAIIGGGVTLAVQMQRNHRDNQLLWQWNRALIDQIYRGDAPPPVPPPPKLFS